MSERAANRRQNRAKPEYLGLDGISGWHRYIYERFGDIISIPSFDFMSKTDDSWLMVGDHRSEIAARILLVVERYGIGVGMMVLQAQQLHSRHIPLEISEGGSTYNLAVPTERLHGTRGESLLFVPVRRFRSDFAKLADLDIVKPSALWDSSSIVSHEHDRAPCFYCSAHEINPSEVVVDVAGSRLGLSRDYSFGFTFAPFGNPVHVMHFLAWDCSDNPFNMNRTPMTVSDLVELTRQVNISIRDFLAPAGIDEIPVVDGVSNGWAGNSIYHQHFQFFQPEYRCPISQCTLESRHPLLERDDVRIGRLAWQTPVYKIVADDSVNVGLVGNDLAGVWRLIGGGAKVPHKELHDGYELAEHEKIPVHTQNLYVPGHNLGREAYVLLRDKRSVNYKPKGHEYLDRQKAHEAQPKDNIGVLEATGTMIVDDFVVFKEMSAWDPNQVTVQIDKICAAIRPEKKQVDRFERNLRDLFPH